MRTKLFVILFLLNGCFFGESRRMFRQAEEAAKNKQFKEAIDLYGKVVKRYSPEPVAIQAASRVAEIFLSDLKDFNKALQYNRHIVLYSSNEKIRYQAQQKIATIVFENLTDYQQAISEYNRLVDIASDEEEKFFYKKQIAKAYYFLDQFYQAETEVESLLAATLTDEHRYDLLLLKGHILLATKKIDEAIKIYSKLMDEFPDQASRDNVALHLAIGYEEKKDFNRAIEVLDELKEGYRAPELIDQKILNLKKRQSHLPGAKGLRK